MLYSVITILKVTMQVTSSHKNSKIEISAGAEIGKQAIFSFKQIHEKSTAK
jgi:hypothetical protein